MIQHSDTRTDFVLASDHAGIQLKQLLIQWLEQNHYSYTDLGTNDEKLDDIGSDYADAVTTQILSGTATKGILICGTGVGVSIRANRYPGIRAATVWTEFGAEAARSHNNANIICFGERQIAPPIAQRCLELFATTAYEGGRHDKRNQAMDRPLASPTTKDQAA